MTKDILVESKKSSTGMQLPDQDLKLLFIMHTKRSFSGKEIYSYCQKVLLGRNVSMKPRISSIYE